MSKQFYEGVVKTTAKGKFYQGVVSPYVPGSSSQAAQQPWSAADQIDMPYAPQLIKYKNTIVQYNKSQWITASDGDDYCAEIAFLNLGDGNFPTPAGATVNILGFPILPGFGISFDGMQAEADFTKYQLLFSGPGVQNCAVFRKMYA